MDIQKVNDDKYDNENYADVIENIKLLDEPIIICITSNCYNKLTNKNWGIKCSKCEAIDNHKKI